MGLKWIRIYPELFYTFCGEWILICLIALIILLLIKSPLRHFSGDDIGKKWLWTLHVSVKPPDLIYEETPELLWTVVKVIWDWDDWLFPVAGSYE